MGTSIPKDEQIEKIKCTVVGDGGVGKTCLCYCYATNALPENYQTYIPTIMDEYSANIIFDGNPVHIELWDTAGEVGSNRLAPLIYNKTDVFLMCFSISDPTSYDNIRGWLSVIGKYVPPTTPFILVGTKLDQRNDKELLENLKKEGLSPLTTEQGLQLCKDINAKSYIEVSSYQQKFVKTLFDTAIRTALEIKARMREEKKKKKHCILV